ncbi:MAG: alpha/beta hydrolase [Cyclobacteriaceae bacterium]
MKAKLTVVALCVWGIVLFGCESRLDPLEPGNLVPKTVDQDSSIPSIVVNNTLLHSETYGNPNDPMLVILHGGPGSDYRAMLNCKAFSNDGFFVVFFDQRGSGLSKRYNKDIYTLQLPLDDLTAVIKHYRGSSTQKVFLLGHSWGAMLATAYVNSYPTSISGVVLSEPGGFTWEQTKSYLSRSKKINPFNEESNDVLYPDQLFTGKENEHEILDYKVALSSAFTYIEGNAIGNKGIYPFWRYGAVVQSALLDIARRDGFDWTTNLSEYKTKVLFCYSDFNAAYGVEYAQQLSAAYPNVQLEKINGSGHEIPYFGWDRYYPLAKSYLSQLK